MPVKLMKGPMTVRVEAEVDRVDDDMTWVRCRLVSDLANSKGEVFGEREHHTALVRLVKKHEDLRPFLQREVDALPSIGTLPKENYSTRLRSSMTGTSTGRGSNPMEVCSEAWVRATARVLTGEP